MISYLITSQHMTSQHITSHDADDVTIHDVRWRHNIFFLSFLTSIISLESLVALTSPMCYLPPTLSLSLSHSYTIYFSLPLPPILSQSPLLALIVSPVAFNYVSDILCKIEYDDEATLPVGTDKVIAVYNITGTYVHLLITNRVSSLTISSQWIGQWLHQSTS